ncbi:PP2C family serine/threonine-protein phosphatase [Microbulbifer guangxiensis]|uniref:PP2C family serine/threonine-protein phosphatase n=1 Tax=Microbulbifer guangxiensis TaxID=2904249 RepID=UPI001F2BF7DE|nr:PP2C family serine/threonine-protein phosphatase [Microbulbifer guangxiensis]
MSENVLTAEELSQLLEISGVDISKTRISHIANDTKIREQYRMLLQRIRELCKNADAREIEDISEKNVNPDHVAESTSAKTNDALSTSSIKDNDKLPSVNEGSSSLSAESAAISQTKSINSVDENDELSARTQSKSECLESTNEAIQEENNDDSDSGKNSLPPYDKCGQGSFGNNPDSELKPFEPFNSTDLDRQEVAKTDPINRPDPTASITQNIVTFTKQTNLKETKSSLRQKRTERIQLPNGMVGREYQHSISLPGVSIQECHIPKDLSLKINESGDEVFGTPTTAGEFELRFQGIATNDEQENSKATVFLIARFTVVPDPRTLWQNIPSDPTALFHKPDDSSDCIDHDGIRLLTASKRGRSHAHKGTHRDDEARIKWLEESGWHILAVADGAGSCQYSRRGSEIALNIAIEHLSEALNGEAGTALVDACLAQDNYTSAFTFNGATLQAVHETLIKAGWKAVLAIDSEAETHKLSAKDFSTTFLVLIHKETERGHLVIGFSIGDGALVAYDVNNGVKLLCTPDSGEFAGQTRFLEASLFQSNDIYKRIKIDLISDFTCLMALTDGITDAKFSTESELSQKAPWDALWSEISPQLIGPKEQAKEKMTDWLNFFIAGNHDDRSVALLTGVINND